MTVTAAPDVQRRLLDLQGFDTRLGQLDHAERTLPELQVLRAADGERDAVRRRLGADQGRLDDAATELRRVEADVQVVEQRIRRDEERLLQSRSPKDAQGLEHELASLQRRRSELEDRQLEVMQDLEECQAVVDAIRADLAGISARTADAGLAKDAAVTRIREERERVSADRAALATALPEDLLALYERQRARYGIGAALLQHGVSGGSNLALNPSELQVVRAAAPDAVVLDPESGCILVRTAESGL